MDRQIGIKLRLIDYMNENQEVRQIMSCVALINSKDGLGEGRGRYDTISNFIEKSARNQEFPHIISVDAPKKYENRRSSMGGSSRLITQPEHHPLPDEIYRWAIEQQEELHSINFEVDTRRAIEESTNEYYRGKLAEVIEQSKLGMPASGHDDPNSDSPIGVL